MMKYSRIENIVSQINDFLDLKFDISSFTVLRFDGENLIIAGSFDFCYYHNVEIKFSDVYFFSGDFDWTRNDNTKAMEVESEFAYQNSRRFKFVFNTDNVHYSNDKERIVIWASAIEYNTDTVLYHKPDKLEKGQRLADWLK